MINRKFKSPTSINLEITEKCNAKCLHCYNPWREEHMGINALNIENIKITMDKLKKSEIFHVVLTGGEPMSNMEVLYAALEYGKKLGFSFSCNSNLMLTNNDKMKKLKDLGLDHILTSFPSINLEENDRIMQVKNSVEKIKKGITNCINNGIRVSVNMVITKNNYQDVLKTGLFVAKLGCQKLFITRAVPPVYDYSNEKPEVSEEYKLSHEEMKFALDQALEVKSKTGIMLGTLVNLPVCFLGDLEKYKDFFGRGCPSQRGHRMNINATGDMHVCVHEDTHYGNIFNDNLEEVYANKMDYWHDKKQMIYEGCKGCEYISTCYSGCQMVAIAFNGKFGTKDPLYVGPNAVSKRFMVDNEDFKELEKVINEENRMFEINTNIRFREEKDFYLLNIRWANTISLNYELGLFLKKNINKNLFLKDFPCSMLEVKFLIIKGVLKIKDFNLEEKFNFDGLSANIESLPYFNKIE